MFLYYLKNVLLLFSGKPDSFSTSFCMLKINFYFQKNRLF
ncbi:hypothetical protein BRYFOR_05156 [Marvinbryantia formatexigens DSM 14469]|uniref:Uncharacterized protein n=1 Tax=Marvinbryantia formatexigens DSM 14469 TaxID=478749 RepID=C6L966_9FIRM|nr:hypothetical protein BRYFOR_05156 [Marvinbryantia formatexigens DSM 14469]